MSGRSCDLSVCWNDRTIGDAKCVIFCIIVSSVTDSLRHPWETQFRGNLTTLDAFDSGDELIGVRVLLDDFAIHVRQITPHTGNRQLQVADARLDSGEALGVFVLCCTNRAQAQCSESGRGPAPKTSSKVRALSRRVDQSRRVCASASSTRRRSASPRGPNLTASRLKNMMAWPS